MASDKDLNKDTIEQDTMDDNLLGKRDLKQFQEGYLPLDKQASVDTNTDEKPIMQYHILPCIERKKTQDAIVSELNEVTSEKKDEVCNKLAKIEKCLFILDENGNL